MAAVLSADMDHTDKVVTLHQGVQDMGLEVLPPDVNASVTSSRSTASAASATGWER